MMTGRLPFENGVRDDDSALGGDERPLAQMLRDRGYATGGVVSSGLLRRATGLARDFDFFDDEVPAGDGDLPPAFRRRSGAESEDIAERWLGGSRHHAAVPLPPHRRAARASKRRRTTTRLSAADAVIGRFVRYLKSHQLYDQSTIFLVSDHGEGLGDHGEEEHGLFIYNEGIHVPLIVKPAAGGGAGRRVADVVQLADIVPTVLDLVKAPQPGNLRGRSLKPLTEGGTALSPLRVYSESRYARNRFGWSELVSMTDGQFQYIPRAARRDLRPAARSARTRKPRRRRRIREDARRTADCAVRPTGGREGRSAGGASGGSKGEGRDGRRIPVRRKRSSRTGNGRRRSTCSRRSCAPNLRPLRRGARLRTSRRWRNGTISRNWRHNRSSSSRPTIPRRSCAQPASPSPRINWDDAAANATAALDLGSKNARANADAHAMLAVVALARDDRDMARAEALESRKADAASLLPRSSTRSCSPATARSTKRSRFLKRRMLPLPTRRRRR